MNRFILYAFIVSASRHGILLHAFCAMSTHLHYVVTDPLGNLPRFLEMFHRLVALGVKTIRNWEGAVWDRSQTSVVALCTRQAIIEKIAYTLANPVTAGLVRRAYEWPGAKTQVVDIGNNRILAQRPTRRFRSDNPNWILNGELAVSVPPSIPDTDVSAFRDDIKKALAIFETAAHAFIPKHEVLGAKRAMKVRPESRITRHERNQQINPTFAVGRGDANRAKELRKVASDTLRDFRTAYRKAFNQWQKGNRTVEFPAGTYAMRVLHGVNVTVMKATRQ